MKTHHLLASLCLVHHTLADPTWPSDIDELEEIMYQLFSFRARKFADVVSPCSSQASGPGRHNAAEWLRAGFHDMATANTYFGVGGMDGSLQYELDSIDNTGPGHRNTVEFMAPFVSQKSSLADLLALGVHTSVRSCGGPAVPVHAGRRDALKGGPVGVPQPQNPISVFESQFERMGFSPQEMIQLTACGHTLGGVHSAEFPLLVPNGTAKNGEALFDSTVAKYDNSLVKEYLAGNTTDRLVVGASIEETQNSDFVVFNSDGNATVEALADLDTFMSVCQKRLQKMIEVVPPDVVLLDDPIAPYMVKPVDLQLTLADRGTTLVFTGYIRVRTTELAKETIDSLTLNYRHRDGDSVCNDKPCSITLGMQGVSQGFDDTFAFFPIEHDIPVETGISSFTVTINRTNGTSHTYDNNGYDYPLQDAIALQTPQSCVMGSSGALTLTAAVRNDVADEGATALIYFKVPQEKSPVPLLKNETVQLTKTACVGSYTLFTVDYAIEGGYAYEATVDLISKGGTDSFKRVTDLGGRCSSFEGAAGCQGVPYANTSSRVTTLSATPSSGQSTGLTVSSGSKATATAGW